MDQQAENFNFQLLRWKNFFKIYSNSAVMWCSDQSNDLSFNSIDQTVILFLRLLLDKQKDGLLIYPFNKLNLLPVLAAEALYHRVQDKKRKKVLLIGERNICIRDAFQKLKNASHEPLERHFSIGIVRPDGTVTNISKLKYNFSGKKRVLEPLLLFSSSVNILPNKDISNQIFSIIVEIGSDTDKDFLKKIDIFKENNGLKSIFYITSDASCEQKKNLVLSGIPYWSWGQDELIEELKADSTFALLDEKYLNNIFSTPFYQIKNCLEGVEKFIIPVKEDKLNEMLLVVKDNFKLLIKHANEINSSSLGKAAISYLKIIHSFEQMMFPLRFNEREYSCTWGTTTIENKIQYLSSMVESLRDVDPTASSFFHKSIEDLKQIYNFLQNNDSGKPVLVVQIIEESIKNNKKLAIILKNRASKIALLSFLESSHNMNEQMLTMKGVSIEYSKNEDNLSNSDLGLFYNPTYRSKNLLRNCCCSKIIFLVYASEMRSLEYIIEDDFYEMDSISSYDQKVTSACNILKINKKNIESIVKKPINSISKFKRPIIIESQHAHINDFKYSQLSDELTLIDLSVDSGFNELDNHNELLFYQNSLSLVSSSDLSEVRNYYYGKRIKANLIKLEGGKGLFTAYDKTVPIYLNWNREIKNKKATEVKTGDLLILINNGLKKTLAEQVVDTVEKHPKMIEVVLYQKYWIESLRKNMLLNKDSSLSLFKKLKEKGSKIETQTAVYFWASGEIIGPSKKNRINIKFIGEIYGDKFLVENSEKIYNSIDRLRRIHIRLKRNLHNLMINAGLMLETGGENQVIDEELGLYLEDFANSIAIKRVVSVEGPYDIEANRTEQIFDIEA